MNEWMMLMVEGAVAGVIAGLVWTRWAKKEWIKTENGDVKVFGILGAICTGIYLFYFFTDTPMNTRKAHIPDLGVMGPFLLVGAIVIWLSRPFLRKPERRLSPGESED